MASKRFTRARNAIIALTATAALVAACGSDDSSSNSADQGVKAVGCKSDQTSGERVVKDTYYGDVTIPADPQRIVSGWMMGTELIDLDVTPVGMFGDDKNNATPEELAKVKDVPDIGSISAGINTEQIMQLKPDLVMTFVRKDVVEKLNAKALDGIVPVVAFEIEEPIDVWNALPKVADALGCGAQVKTELERLSGDFTKIAAEDKTKIGELGTVAYVEGSAAPATYQVATNTSLVYERLTKSGLTYFDGVPDNPKRYNEQISMEDIDRLSSANVLFFEADSAGKPTARTQALLDSAAFKTLPAVKAGNLFPYRTPYAYTIAAGDRQVEDITKAIAEAKPAP